jgi:hypothetical protein
LNAAVAAGGIPSADEQENYIIDIDENRPGPLRDVEAETGPGFVTFQPRVIEAVGRGSRRPQPRRWVRDNLPTMGPVLDEANGTTGEPYTLSAAEVAAAAEAERQAAEEAAKAEQAAAADEEQAAMLDVLADALEGVADGKPIDRLTRAKSLLDAISYFGEKPYVREFIEPVGFGGFADEDY